MKKTILFLMIIFIASAAQAQTLKDLLYSGKLKKDSTGVVRKTDDLSTKIDTSQKKAEPEKQRSTAVAHAGTSEKIVQPGSAPAVTAKSVQVTTVTTEKAEEGNTPPVTPSAVPVKSNNKIWKEYTDNLIAELKDVLSSKKVKKETYYFLVEYEIATNGATNIINVTASPENDYLLGFVKQKISDYPPQLTPVLNSATNQPQKVKRRYNFYITKE